MESFKNAPGNWERRRRLMYLLVAFAMVVIAYCLYKNLDTRVAETAVDMAFALLMAVMGFYIAGASYQDVMFKKQETEREYYEEYRHSHGWDDGRGYRGDRFRRRSYSPQVEDGSGKVDTPEGEATDS